jgi:hypothetical protein
MFVSHSSFRPIPVPDHPHERTGHQCGGNGCDERGDPSDRHYHAAAGRHGGRPRRKFQGEHFIFTHPEKLRQSESLQAEE